MIVATSVRPSIPSDNLVATHAQRIQSHLAVNRKFIVPYRWLDPTDQVDVATGQSRLQAALEGMNDAQQAAATLSGSELPAWPLRWGDIEGLAQRTAYFDSGLQLGSGLASLVALTPIPVSFFAHALDSMQPRTLNAHVRGREHLEYLLYAAVALAADGLAGTGELPNPRRLRQWTWSYEAPMSVPCVGHTVSTRDRLDQGARIARQAYWDAAEELAGQTHHGGSPVQRFVPGWGRLEALHGATGVRYNTRSDRARLREASWSLPISPSESLSISPTDWRRLRISAAQRELGRIARGSYRLSRRSQSQRLSSSPGIMRNWFNRGDLVQRCRWRAIVLAGGDDALAERLERTLLDDALNRYLFHAVPHEDTSLPAQAAWHKSLEHAAAFSTTWKIRPEVADGRVANLVRLGYTPRRWRADTGLWGASPEDIAVAAELTGGRVFT